MKILQVTKRYPHGGGSGKIAADLHEGYMLGGHDSTLATLDPSTLYPQVVLGDRSRTPLLDEWIAPRLKKGGEVFLRKSGLRSFKKIREWQANFFTKLDRPTRSWAQANGHEYFGYRGIWDWMNQCREWPDIIHGHTIEGDFFDIRAIPELSKKCKTVFTLHNAWMMTGLCHHWVSCTRWEEGCGQCPVIHEFPQYGVDGTASNWKLKKKLWQKSKLYIASPAQWLIDAASKSILSEGMVEGRVIPNGIDLGVFHPGDRNDSRKKLGIGLEEIVLLFVGNKTKNNKWKRYEWMIDALKNLVGKTDLSKVTFLLLGQEGATIDNHPFKVKFASPESDPKRIALYYQASDLYLHAALMDTFPNAVLEAMACGLPVVATKVGGIPEQVIHGTHGYLSKAGDAEEMAHWLKILLENPSQRLEMGRAAAKRAVDLYDKRRMVKDYLEWFEEICGDRP